MTRCCVSAAVSGPCAGCGKPTESTHICDLGGGAMALYGPCCCPEHSAQAALDWDDPPKTVAGEQTTLFDGHTASE
jgi:hypothetical protein